MVADSFPLKPIKTIIKQQFKGEITAESVLYLRDILPIVICYLVKEAVKEHEKVNDIRIKRGFPERKRLNKISFKCVFERTFKLLEDEKAGNTGEKPIEIQCSPEVS